MTSETIKERARRVRAGIEKAIPDLEWNLSHAKAALTRAKAMQRCKHKWVDHPSRGDSWRTPEGRLITSADCTLCGYQLSTTYENEPTQQYTAPVCDHDWVECSARDYDGEGKPIIYHSCRSCGITNA